MAQDVELFVIAIDVGWPETVLIVGTAWAFAFFILQVIRRNEP